MSPAAAPAVLEGASCRLGASAVAAETADAKAQSAEPSWKRSRHERIPSADKASGAAEESCDQGYSSRLDALASVAQRLCGYVTSLQDRDEPVVRLASPEAIREAFREAGVGVQLSSAGGEQGQEPLSQEAILQAVNIVLRHSVRTGHPLFFNQLYARADPAAIAADWVVAATNTNVFTYEVAPVYTMLEVESLRRIAELVGGGFAKCHDGLFLPGGSISNLYAMHLARFRADPEVATRGAVGGPRCVAFVSEQCHYSFLKSARLIGVGSDNLIAVQSDELGRMRPQALEEAITKAEQEGGRPFFVGATAGTTVIGAYDPFEEIGEICRRRGLWHHVDGCWGGAALLSPRHRHLLSGAEDADSFCWNPHKMCSGGLQCSAFLTRHKGLLARANASQAAYLFQPDKLNSDLDLGDKTIQCGRRADVFKLWLLWKAKGDVGMQFTVDRCFHLAAFMANRIREESTASGAWELAHSPSCSNVCFWYVPKRLRPFKWGSDSDSDGQASQQKRDALHQVAPLMKNEMQRRGDAMIGFQAVNGRPNFFRMVFAGADIVQEEDIVQLMGRMAAIGEEVSEQVS